MAKAAQITDCFVWLELGFLKVTKNCYLCNEIAYNISFSTNLIILTMAQDLNNPFDSCGVDGKSRGVAALLAILLGSLGIQYFYLGKTGAGLITILLSFVTCGVWGILMFVQGIYMFCITNDEFRTKYVETTRTLPLF